MASNNSKDYSQIERPYDVLLERTQTPTYPNQSDPNIQNGSDQSSLSAEQTYGSGANGNVEDQPVKSDGAMGDVWIDNFIRSKNWKPKSVGFYIDGQTGYAEFSNVFVSGNIEALSGTIGGFTIGDTDLTATDGVNTTILSSGATAFSAGPTGFPTVTITQDGVLTATGASITGSFTATSGSIGGFDIGADYVRDSADSMGMASTVTVGDDVRFWAGDTYANRATAPFSVTEAGVVSASNITITGGSVSGVPIFNIPNDSNTDISLLEKTYDMVFSVTDADTIAWTSGTITLSNGRTFAIDAGNTGNMVALSYIYLDPATSETVLQVTTTYSTAIGADKILIGTAENGSITAYFIPYGPGQALINGDSIGALSIVAGNIATGTITAGKMNVSELSAIAADLGTITAGSVSVVSGANTIGLTPLGTYAIFSGTTGSPEFRVTPGGVLTATGATISGNITATTGAIGGFDVGSDYIRDSANSFGLSSTVTGGNDVRFWAGDTYANRDIASLRIYESGDFTMDYGADISLLQGGNINFTSVTDAGACTAALIATGTGNVDDGTHLYKITFVNAVGETQLSTASNTVTVDPSNKQVSLTGIELSTSNSVISRKIYRTKAGASSTYYYLDTISDNTTTTYTDNIADSSLGINSTFRENDTLGKILVDGVESLTLGPDSVYVGRYAGDSMTTGFNNTGIGKFSLYGLTSGYQNVAIGNSSLFQTTTGRDNTAVGWGALSGNITGDFNTAVGTSALGSATGERNIAIGHYAGLHETGSNSFYVDSYNRNNTAGDKAGALLYGTIDITPANQTLMVNGVLSTSSVGNSAGNVLTTDGTQTLTNKTITAPEISTIELGHASDTTLSRSSAGVLAVEGVAVPTISSTDTLTNKTIVHKNGAFKTSDETINNSSTTQDDDELFIAIGASDTWSFDIDLIYDTGTTPDIKFAVSVPTGATGLWSFVDSSSNVTHSTDGVSTGFSPGGGAGFIRQVRITGYVINSTNTGNITLRWAQNTADASDTIVKAGSRFVGIRLS